MAATMQATRKSNAFGQAARQSRIELQIPHAPIQYLAPAISGVVVLGAVVFALVAMDLLYLRGIGVAVLAFVMAVRLKSMMGAELNGNDVVLSRGPLWSPLTIDLGQVRRVELKGSKLHLTMNDGSTTKQSLGWIAKPQRQTLYEAIANNRRLAERSFA